MNNYLKCIFVLNFFLQLPLAFAANNKISLKGTIVNGSGYQVALMSTSGDSKIANTNARGAFSFTNLEKSFVSGASLQLITPSGSYFGPVVLANKKTRGFLNFSGNGKKIDLKKINLKDGFAKVAKISSSVYAKNTITDVNTTTGKPDGAGKSGVVESSISSFELKTFDDADPGRDIDGDGIPSAFDFDDDGDLNLDVSDSDSANSSAHDSPFTTLYLGLSQTLNVNVGDLTQDDIDAVIGGEDLFALAFYFSDDPALTVTGGHVICDSSLVYCRSNADGGSTAIYSGATESDDSLRGLVWSNINTDGSGYPNLEIFSSNQAKVAFIQPRVGTSQFRPGDSYQVVLVNGSTTVETKTLSLPPYFVTVPAINTYNAGSGSAAVDYSNSNTPGANSSNPIVISSDGLLTLNLWKPQRQAVSGAESGSYRDMGHLHYGVIVSGVSSEFTCGGLYSSLSSTLTEDSDPLGTDGSVFSQDGANLWPLTDSSDDLEPNTSNILSFTVNLKSCLTRAGQSGTGDYQITLTAAGEDFSGGANRAAQTFNVRLQ